MEGLKCIRSILILVPSFKPERKQLRWCKMDSWVVGQISFWYTVYEVKPAAIVDKLISFWIDIVTPGRGAGEANWWMRGLRTLEQSTDRASRELDIRRSLRDWDHRYPEIHHELIVRWVSGALVSVVATSFYNSLRKGHSQRRYY